MILFRRGKGGGGENAFGQWYSRTSAASAAIVRIDSAVKPKWINSQGTLTGTSPLESVYAIKIPKGTTYYEGPVGYQGGVHVGGQSVSQIFTEKPWNIPGAEVINSWSLR